MGLSGSSHYSFGLGYLIVLIPVTIIRIIASRNTHTYKVRFVEYWVSRDEFSSTKDFGDFLIVKESKNILHFK